MVCTPPKYPNCNLQYFTPPAPIGRDFSWLHLIAYLSIFRSIWNKAILGDFIQKSMSRAHEAMLRGRWKNESSQLQSHEIVRGVLNFVTLWQPQKRSNAARICEISFSKWKVDCWADSRVPIRFASFCIVLRFFHSICLKVLRLPRKSASLTTQGYLANLKIWCFKMQRSQEICSHFFNISTSSSFF